MSDRRTSRPSNSAAQSVQESLSSGSLKKLSEFRRAQIHDAQIKKEASEENSKPGAAILHSPAFKGAMVKKATVGPSALPTTRGLTDMMGPEVYSPLFQLANLNLPRDRVTMNAWNRIFYDTHPIVRNAINLHASFPISKINISHPVKEIQEFFLEMAERIDLYSVVYGVALEYFKLGEVFPYAELDRDLGSWKRITILNPDYVHVKKTAIGDQVIISLRYDVRGTSIIVSVYKDLMLYDKLRESKFAQADGMINPMTLVKLGNGEYRPTQSDIEAMRMALEEAQYDKDFKLVTHDGVAIERVGYNGGVMEIGTDVEHILANLYAGLMVPKALMDQEGATYASSSVGLEVLRQRYDIFRNMIKKWLEQKIFAPISELQDFFIYQNGKKVLQVPVIDFNHMNLYDMSDYVQNISNLVGNKQISLHTLYRSLGLSYEEERRRLKEEAIHETIKLKQAEALQTMRLRELEGLDVDSVIQESPEGGAAGGAAPPGLPGMEAPGGPPGGSPGGPPDMGAPPPGGPPPGPPP